MNIEKIKFVDTTTRDGQQSLIATRMKTEEMLPILDEIDKLGLHAIECWGGATFDSCIRYLDEDPWERLRAFKERMPNTKLQMLLRGQNLLGYRHYADDVVDKFVERSVANGIDIIRNFDALNDVRNLEAACKATKKYGAHSQMAISYTISPVHTVEYYVGLAKFMRDVGADSICIKDMSGILKPQIGKELVAAIKAEVALPLEIHSHCTAGLAPCTYSACIDAGADIIDTAFATFADGTSQPAIETMLMIMEGRADRPDLDMDRIARITDYFRDIRARHEEAGHLSKKALMVEPNIVKYQLPGGMLSNLVSQLKAQNAEHRYEEVLREIPHVRADLGYPPLVTPLSQMVGVQSVFNVLTGERYKLVPTEIKKLLRGEYGRTPAEISQEIIDKIIPGQERITCRPADRFEPEYEVLKSEIGGLAKTDEDVLTYALFPEVGKAFLEKKYS